MVFITIKLITIWIWELKGTPPMDRDLAGASGANELGVLIKSLP